MDAPALYFDYAAATPLSDEALAAMRQAEAAFYNPSALYADAQRSRQLLETARSGCAAILGARPSEIIFTAGGTEADNLAIHGVMHGRTDSTLLISAIEHEAVLRAAEPYDHKLIPVTAEGIVDVTALEKLLDDRTRLISVMYANNEIGSVQPIAKIGQLVQRVRDDRRRRGVKQPLYFHSDACQAAGCLNLQTARLGVDMLTLNGGKIYGPKRSGLLYVRGGLQLEPLIRGGGQERGLRSGTEDVPACAGLAVALQSAQLGRRDESQRLQQLQQQFMKQLATKIPWAVVQGSREQRLPNNVHLTIPGADNERLLMQLDQAGIMAAAGSACSASSDTPSHVLRAIGLTDAEARASLRFSLGRGTTGAAVTAAVDTLASLVA